jgi:hypothetical protein
LIDNRHVEIVIIYKIECPCLAFNEIERKL